MDIEKGMNREYRDSLFKFIFGNPENKEWSLSLYNAVNGSNYSDPSAIRLNTLEDVVYMSMKNDVSFLVYNTMNIYEHQSTYNPNVPMRIFIYAGMLYDKFIEQSSSYHKYSSALQKAPTPKCVCFYNGTRKTEDRVELRLSDAFDGESDIEVKVTMININYGHNKALLEACKPLKEYSWFVDRIQAYQKVMDSLEEAVDAAIDELSDDSLIKPFLLANKAEVKRMCITEYDETRAFAEQLEEGIEIGEEKGKLELLVDLVKEGVLTLADAAKRAHMSVSDFSAKTGLNA